VRVLAAGRVCRGASAARGLLAMNEISAAHKQ
jgi:hypothetical protein